MSVHDKDTQPWIIDVSKTAYVAGYHQALVDVAKNYNLSDPERRFELWWNDAHGQRKCWCGEPVVYKRFCHPHAPRCPSGAHFDGGCMCKGVQ
jgi:hypothetical protein